jgi:flavin-dependent dehydrogenase
MNASCPERPCTECDVAVLGGGPAGAVAALTLARAGRIVAVIERSRYDCPRIGETLPPSARPLLTRLGLWRAFLAAGHLPSPSVLSVWGDDALYENFSILNPHGTGWHLDRRRFDRMLLAAALHAGASAYCGARLATCESATGGGWELAFTNDSSAGEPLRRLRATTVIDATGRAAAFARRQHARRLNTDRLIGLVMFSDARETDAEDDSCGGCTLVEACADGWWYSALLPDRRLIAVYMTDADLVPQPRDWRSFWHARLDQTVHTHGRLAGRRVQGPARLVAASTSRLDRTGGACWLAAGDAVAALDPLSSQGLVHALSSGVHAAVTVDRQLAGDATAVEAYTLEIDRVLREYSRLRAVYYGRERRWPQSRFWQRRHAIAA